MKNGLNQNNLVQNIFQRRIFGTWQWKSISEINTTNFTETSVKMISLIHRDNLVKWGEKNMVANYTAPMLLRIGKFMWGKNELYEKN